MIYDDGWLEVLHDVMYTRCIPMPLHLEYELAMDYLDDLENEWEVLDGQVIES